MPSSSYLKYKYGIIMKDILHKIDRKEATEILMDNTDHLCCYLVRTGSLENTIVISTKLFGTTIFHSPYQLVGKEWKSIERKSDLCPTREILTDQIIEKNIQSLIDKPGKLTSKLIRPSDIKHEAELASVSQRLTEANPVSAQEKGWGCIIC